MSGRVTVALPTYNNGEQQPISLDINGRTIVVGSGSGGETTIVGTFDVNNDIIPLPPDPFMTVPVYPALVIDVPTQAFTFLVARIPADNVAQPVALDLQPLDVMSRNMHWRPGTSVWARSHAVPLNANFDDATIFGQAAASAGFSRIPGGDWTPNLTIEWLTGITAIPANLPATGACLILKDPDNEEAYPGRCDINGSLRAIIDAPASNSAVGAALSHYNPTAATAGFIIDRAARLLSIAWLDVDQDCWLVLVNKAAAPVNGDAIVWSWAVDTIDAVGMSTKQGYIGRDYFGQSGMWFSTGIAWAWSSTRNTVTLIGAAPGSMVIQAQYT